MGNPAVALVKDGGLARAPRTSRLGVGAGRGSRNRVGDAALCVMAAVEACTARCVESIMTKWPNMIVLNGKKYSVALL